MKPFNVYLCGPMAANTYEQANGWRLHAFERLEPYGITVVSPMREKDMFDNSTLMGVDYSTFGDVPELRAASIFTRDCYDVDHANIILANFTDLGKAWRQVPYGEGNGGDRDDWRWTQDVAIPSLGSDMEMARAEVRGIPIVMVAPEGNYYRKHPFSIVCADIIFDELDSACSWIIKNFKPYRDA